MVTIGTISLIIQQIDQLNTQLEIQGTLRQVLLDTIEGHRVNANTARDEYEKASMQLAEMDQDDTEYENTLGLYVYWSQVLSYHQDAINELNARVNESLDLTYATISKITNLTNSLTTLGAGAVEYLSSKSD